MSLPLRKVASILVSVTVAATVSCRDGGITKPGPSASEPEGLIVSSPSLSTSAAQEMVAFVSLVPGTAPGGGVSARIQNRATRVAQTVSLIDDGFDPVAIAAQVGDTIDVVVTNAAGVAVLQAAVPVKAQRHPVVVRTNPPLAKRDVSLDVNIQVVFSAPIDATTLTTESVQLLRGTTRVTGTLELNDPTGIRAEFHPTSLLATNTQYRFVITQTIRDVNHVALESPVAVEFSTGNDALATATLVFVVQPTNTTAGVAFSSPIVVAVRDASGNTIIYASSPVTIAWQGGSTDGISGGTIVNAVNGIATFDDLSITRSGSQFTLVASYTGTSPVLTSAPSARFSVDPGAPSKLGFVGPLSADASQQFVAHVWVSDAFGNSVRNAPVGPVTVSLSSNPGGATLGGTLTVPVFNGVATFANLTLDRPGVGYVLQATSGSWSATLKLDVWNAAAFSAVSAGGAHTCGLTRDDYAFCWGANANGQVGAGTTTDYASPVIVASRVTSVTAGGNHTCAIAAAGLYCWGLNDDGQLGDGTKMTRLSPTRTTAAFGAASGAITGGAHSCGETDYGYTSTCWGSNAYGQLGDLRNTSPAVYALVAGGSHSCGTDYGFTPMLYCWGSNVNGQLGTGTMLTFSPTVLRVAYFFGDASVSAGRAHTCANITVTGTNGLFCWGANDAGQLGDGTTVQRSTPALVNGGPFSSVSAGGSHTCALNSAGAAYCWGANDHGQVGDGTTTMRTSPVPVAGGLTFVSLSAGSSHTCGVTVSGTYCWGANGNGQLGNGTTTDTAMPAKVSGQ